MINLIKKIITNSRGSLSAEPQDNDLRTRIAASVILLEAAGVDSRYDPEEHDHILNSLQDTFALSHEYAEELVELAHQEKSAAIDLWQFTNQINQEFSRPEKQEVMQAVWRVIYADGELEKHEDHFAHKLANLLRLTHKEMIDAKLAAREQCKALA